MSHSFERPGSSPSPEKLLEIARKQRITSTPSIVRQIGRPFLGKFLLRNELSVPFHVGPLAAANYGDPEQMEAALLGAAEGWVSSRGEAPSSLTPEEEQMVDERARDILEKNRK